MKPDPRAHRKRVFFGMKEQVPAPASGPRRNTDEAPDVDVWNTVDERIQSLQMMRAEADRNFTFRQAFDLSAGKFVKLADATMRDLDVAQDGRWAVGRDTRGYISDYKRAAADIYRVNITTGERTLMLKNQMINTSTGNHTCGISPDGRHFLYWKDNKFQVYDLDSATSRTLGGNSAVSFVDMEFDHPGPTRLFAAIGMGAGVTDLYFDYNLNSVCLLRSRTRDQSPDFGDSILHLDVVKHLAECYR